ncbi:hypothetical protein B0T25DRAFT_339923 [Lasiosphaeria hispida]|uniref:Uncharacterized protein n=1 Tax=Lasiosphaeria hispida TaxID=260671 RepID=A0AAJ0H6Q8_9PEZI|nr:hypothetical protein B0T25DRAFT_339923 [Lasiosphaeria hispida]
MGRPDCAPAYTSQPRSRRSRSGRGRVPGEGRAYGARPSAAHGGQSRHGAVPWQWHRSTARRFSTRHAQPQQPYGREAQLSAMSLDRAVAGNEHLCLALTTPGNPVALGNWPAVLVDAMHHFQVASKGWRVLPVPALSSLFKASPHRGRPATIGRLDCLQAAVQRAIEGAGKIEIGAWVLEQGRPREDGMVETRCKQGLH